MLDRCKELIKNIIKKKKTKKDFFNKRNIKKETIKNISSPSGKYILKTANYATGANTWDYSKGTVSKGRKIIAEVYRNYGHFWYSWAEGHPDGHDYLICGEDYQGQTIIRLDTGEKVDYLPNSASSGSGFCWMEVNPSLDKLKLAVNGCYWGAPSDVIIVDFSKPLDRLNTIGYLDCDNINVVSWNDNGSLNVSTNEIYRKSDGKLLKDLTSAEAKEMWENNDHDDMDILSTVIPKNINNV